MNCHTMCGHVEGMLDRDQRTAKQRTLCDYNNKCCDTLRVHYRQNSFINFYERKSLNISRAYPLSYHKRSGIRESRQSRKNCYFWNTIRRLKQVLIAGIYLLSLISVPYSLSAPTKQRLAMSNRYDSIPKWINPANLKLQCSETDLATQPTDAEIIEPILLQTTTAHSKAVVFREDLTSKNFDVSVPKLIEDFKNSHYENWLPNEEITNILNNVTDPKEHFSRLTLPQALVDMYRSLQIVAVGLEQITWDQEDDGSPFVQEFNQSEYNLRLVLAEMQTAIYERGFCNQMHPDVQRDWMPETMRKPKDDTDKKMRDWIIYRDYIDLLKYIMKVLDYFKFKSN